MKFSLLLFLLYRKLRSTSKKKPEFKEKLKEKNYTLLIKTDDGRHARYFTFQDGEIISKGKLIDISQVALIWNDANTGFKTMTSKDEGASVKALQEGKLRLEGDGQLALWFTEVVKQMMKAK